MVGRWGNKVTLELKSTEGDEEKQKLLSISSKFKQKVKRKSSIMKCWEDVQGNNGGHAREDVENALARGKNRKHIARKVSGGLGEEMLCIWECGRGGVRCVCVVDDSTSLTEHLKHWLW